MRQRDFKGKTLVTFGALSCIIYGAAQQHTYTRSLYTRVLLYTYILFFFVFVLMYVCFGVAGKVVGFSLILSCPRICVSRIPSRRQSDDRRRSDVASAPV
uniref:Uncharacterized protein n=1 Tax=Trichogramma kaykai TaxID=54128 RepID=A0ABD2W7C5_9HYME